MIGIYKRQRRLYLFSGLVVTIAVVNVLFFLILYRPTRSDYFQLRDSIGTLRSETAMRQRLVDQKEKTIAQLETSNQDKQKLFVEHFTPRKVGFAAILPAIDSLAQKSGVRWSRFDDAMDATPQYGMYSVKIRYPVQGGYSNIVNFIRELEKSKTFFVISSIDLRNGTDNVALNGAGNVALALSLESFFYQ